MSRVGRGEEDLRSDKPQKEERGARRGANLVEVFRKRKHGLMCSPTLDIPVVVSTSYAPKQPTVSRARPCGSYLAALACLLLLAAAVYFAPAAGAASAGTHRAAHAAAKGNAAKKKKPAPPTIKMKLLGSVAPESPFGIGNSGWLHTDGVRWAAYEATAGITRLIDTVKNKTIERPDPEGCADGLIAVGGGEMLYSCEDPECPEHEHICPLPSNKRLAAERYVVEDIASGEQHPVAGENTLLDNGNEGGPSNLYQIGSQWAEGDIGSNEGSSTFFLNWHAGSFVSEDKAASEKEIENLSNPTLTQRLCKPITRLKNEDEYQSVAYSPLQYEPPFAVLGPLGLASDVSYVPLQLRKCGSVKRVLLAPGGSVQLGGRVLSWEGQEPYVTQLYAKGRKWHGPYYKLVGLPSEGSFGLITVVQHTSNMVFATLKPGLGPAEVYLARLPWARPAR